MLMETLYRFCSGNLGVYAAVDRDCPRDDIRRKTKSDGSWLPKAGPDFPGAISFWTEAGLDRYFQSGLQDWHRRVLREPLLVQTTTVVRKILYQDEMQVICNPTEAIIAQNLSWENFAANYAEEIVEKVVAYVTRTKSGQKELLVFDHEIKWKDAGTQVPAGTIKADENPEQALLRELTEESGLKELSIVGKVDEYVLYRKSQNKFNRRHVYELNARNQPPDTWEHLVCGNGDDNGMLFSYFWIPVGDACLRLAEGLGDSTSRLSHLFEEH